MKSDAGQYALFIVGCLLATSCGGSTGADRQGDVDAADNAGSDAVPDAMAGQPARDASGPKYDAGEGEGDGRQHPAADAAAADAAAADAAAGDAAAGDAADVQWLDGAEGADAADAAGDAGPAYGAEFFVASNGSDQSPGTLQEPFATLERARTAVRQLKAASGLPAGGVVVWLRGGVYERSATLELTQEDSGEQQRPVVFRGYPGEDARLLGAVRLDPDWFSLVDAASPMWNRIDPLARGQLWQVDLGAHGIDDYGVLRPRGFYVDANAALELFYNRDPMRLGRWPDVDADEPSDTVDHGFARIESALSDTRFTYLGDRPDRWHQAEEIWFHGFWRNMWSDRHVQAESIDTDSATVTLVEVPGYGIETGQPYYVYNLIEEITQPGEWYLDRASGHLYFWPPGDIASAEIYVSVLEDRLLHLNGASHLIVQDLTLEMTRGQLVRIEGGSHNVLLGCTLRNAGTDGAWVSGDDNGLQRCELHGIGDRGVRLEGGDRASLAEANNYVRNCHIHHFGRWSWTYKPAVAIGRGCGQIVAHNRIHDAPHSAILFSGNEHVIEYNHIHDVCRFSSDAGAIYAGRDWGWRGNRIRYNFIHHIDSFFEGYGVHGVYLDDCLSGIRVFGNLFYRVSGHALQNGGGRDNILENNIMARCGDALSGDSRGIQRINNTPGDSWNMLERLTRDGVQYQQDPWASRYPELAAIPNDWAALSDPGALWFYPEGCVFSRNLGFANDRWTRETNYGGTGTFNKYKEIADNIEDQDPLFVDEDNLNLNLQPGSPAYDIAGFVRIPFDEMGIQP